MEIRERIESCLNDLDARRRRMAEFESRVRTLMETLKKDAGSPSTVREILEVLASALENYNEIDGSCRSMISALSEIGRNQEQIEDGRRKIIGGVEKILGHLTQMETLARQSMVEPEAPEAGAAPAEGPRPKKILLIRLRPQTATAGESDDDAAPPQPSETSTRDVEITTGTESSRSERDPIEDLVSADDDQDATIH